MDKFERRRLRLIKIRDELCGGNVAELARTLEKADTYVHRMLYPAGKPGKKRIGEDSVDMVRAKFGVDLDANDALALPPATSPRMFYQWISDEESKLISDFRTASVVGRGIIIDAAESVEKVIIPPAVDHQG